MHDSDELKIVKDELALLIKQGKLTASSPFEGMNDPWTDDEKQQLKSALAEMFGWKQ